MSIRYSWIAVLLVLCLLLTAAGCNKLNLKIPGKVGGQCVNEAGASAGYVSVELVNNETHAVVQAMNAEDNGGFLFDKVDPGEYIIKTKQTGEIEIPNDCQPFKLGPGKTENITVTLYYSKLQNKK